mgnify:CR=1 FL=1
MISRRHILTNALQLSLLAAFPTQAFAQEDAGEPPRRFMMSDVNGAIVTDEHLLGKFGLVYFGYMGCPDICPTSLMTMAAVLKELGKDADRFQPFFVTVDPDRDTPELLSQYAPAFDERIVALRGPKAYTDAMDKAFGAKYEFHIADPKHPEDYTVDHTASIIFTGPDGKILKRFPHDLTSDVITADIRKAMAAYPAE